MTKDDIIRMAREAGLSKIIYNEQNGCATLQTMFHPENIEHFAALVAAAEREECAKEISAEINDEIEDEAYCILVALLARIRAKGRE
jgi:adenylyl- and sulfurtransferase ThiI